MIASSLASTAKKCLGFLLLGMLLLPQMAFAQQNTLLPGYPEGVEFEDEDSDGHITPDEVANQCLEGVTGLDDAYFDRLTPQDMNDFLQSGDSETREMGYSILGCAIRSGYLHLWMLPYFITYFANFFIGIAGLISVLFVLLGGFWYMTGGVTDDKEKGKKTITYALIGLTLTLLAWIIVNVVQVQITR